MMNQRLKSIVLLICMTATMGFMEAIHAQDQWFLSVYGGRFSNNALLDILRFQTEFEESHIYVLSIGKELARHKNILAYELEAQVAFHSGMQSHEEINGVFALRWLPLPWDRFIDTSLGIGNGLSYATAEPPIEKMDQKNNIASQWLYYLYVELAFKPLRKSDWDLFFRVHHRSGIFGLIHDIDSGSNFIGIGIRYALPD